MSLTSELLPDPETPVMQTNVPSGMRTSMPLRLLCAAPTMVSDLAAAGPPICRNLDLLPAREETSGDARVVVDDRVHRAAGHHLAAAHSGAGTEVDDVVGGTDGLFVMFHDHDGVTHVAQAAERVEQALVVARMQADRRLVENVQHADQAGADLPSQPDALRFAARQRGSGTVQRQVIQPDVHQETESAADFLQHFGRDQRLGRPQLQLLKELHRIPHRQLADLRQ